MGVLEHEGLTSEVIGAAIEVHRDLGPGFLESVYENALCIELQRRGVPYERQIEVPVLYRGEEVGLHRLDLLVSERIVVELKAVKRFDDIHFVVVRSYLRAAQLDHGLLFNFAGTTLDIKRVTSRWDAKSIS
jgi:GxxExxY protein